MGRIRRQWYDFVGREATRTDNTITLTLAALGALAAHLVSRHDLSTAEELVVDGLAGDLWGGLWANNTRACARWYERPGQTNRDHVKFAAAHLHPAAIAWLDRNDRDGGAVWAGAHYGYLMAATVLIRCLPRRRRLLGVVTTAGGVVLDRALGPSSAAPWFAPVFYGKLLLGHASAARWSDSELTAAR
ncbi:hypothetical protein ACWDUN_24460 [Mycobacterium sp. NPDC003323]